MASPNPVSPMIAARLDEGDWLGVVDNRELPLHLQASEVLLVVSQKDLKALWRHIIGTPVKSVVEGFCHLEEIVASGDDVPPDGQTQLLENWHQSGQDFRHASAHGRGVDHLHGVAPQRSRQGPQLRHFRLAEDGSVVVNMDQVWNGHARAHRVTSLSTRARSFARALSSVLV